MSATEQKPSWSDYAADVIPRLAKHGASPTTAVVALLGYATENENVGVPDHEVGMCKSWLNRLVDEEGNPLDDKGRDPIQWASEENMIGHHGSLSRITFEDDRVGFAIDVLRAAKDQRSRGETRVMLLPHFVRYLDLLLDALYDDAPSS